MKRFLSAHRYDVLMAIVLAVAVTLCLLEHPATGVALAMFGGLGRPILTQQDLQAHINALSGTQDVVYWPLFDSANWLAAGQQQLTFFTTPIGQPTTTAPGATGNKTLADTNMYSAGQLTKGNEFFMTGQEFLLLPGELIEQVGGANTVNGFVNDTYVALKSGVATLQVGSNRQYIQDGPLINFPPSVRLFVAAAVGGTTTAGTQSLSDIAYATAVGDPYDITPIYIEATQGFQEFIQWPAAVTLTATARIFSRMRGYLIRNAQ